MGEVLALLRKSGIDPRIGYEALTCDRARPVDRDDGTRLGRMRLVGAGQARGRRSGPREWL